MILVLDVSVLIDLCHCKLEPLLARLGKIVITDLVLNEVNHPLFPHFKYRLFTFEDISEIISFRMVHRKPSVPDVSAYLCAQYLITQTKQEVCTVILLTGDKNLRKLCKNSGIPYHGLLWVLDQFVSRGLLSLEEACKALQQILKEGSWLPKGETKKRLKEWC